VHSSGRRLSKSVAQGSGPCTHGERSTETSAERLTSETFHGQPGHRVVMIDPKEFLFCRTIITEDEPHQVK
jgi:hypothetical protein